jgi:hypothetical protein
MMMTAPELGGARGDEKFVTLTRLHGCEQDKERDEATVSAVVWIGVLSFFFCSSRSYS